ncbi:MAG: rhodanese-related sulfurtransferase [Paraglaciecola sp.]
MKNITYPQIQRWQADNLPFQLIDVREPEEHATFNIGGDLIPLEDILRKRDQLDLSKPIVFYCKRGIRSQIAIQKLQRKLPNGDFYNLTSGILHLQKS